MDDHLRRIQVTHGQLLLFGVGNLEEISHRGRKSLYWKPNHTHTQTTCIKLCILMFPSLHGLDYNRAILNYFYRKCNSADLKKNVFLYLNVVQETVLVV
jgi:hypothetical protein